MNDESGGRRAALDEKNRLVGVGYPDSDLPGRATTWLEIDPGDLPLDGSYKWNSVDGRFDPIGHGFPRLSSRPPVSETAALYHVIRALDDEVAKEARDWADWYEKNLKAREEERAVITRKRERR